MKYLDLKINSEQPRVVSVALTDKWNELSKNQLLYIALVWQSWQLMLRNNANMQVAKARLFTALIVDKSNKELKEILNLLSSVDFEESNFNPLALTDFIFESNKLTINKFMAIKIGWFKTLYGPEERLGNSSINEFSFALNFYNAYNKTSNEDFLNNFVACLYRPSYKGWEATGDIRKPFNPFTIEQHLPLVKKMSYAHKQAIYLFFAGSMDSLSNEFKRVFSKSNSEQKSDSKQTFLDIILKISGGKFGNFDQTKDQNAYLVLKELQNLLGEKPKKTT
jgi:hypothetical protein